MPNYKIASQRQVDYDADQRRVSDGIDSLNKAVVAIKNQLGNMGKGSATGSTVTRVISGGSGGTPAGGTVKYVGLSAPSRLSVTGVPISVSGTIVIGDVPQSAGYAFLGPTAGTTAVPTFRAIQLTDLPTGITVAPQVWSFTSTNVNLVMGSSTGYLRVRVDATTGVRTVTLPTAATIVGQPVGVIKTDAGINTVTVLAAGADALNIPPGLTPLATQWDTLTLLATTSGWEVA